MIQKLETGQLLVTPKRCAFSRKWRGPVLHADLETPQTPRPLRMER